MVAIQQRGQTDHWSEAVRAHRQLYLAEGIVLMLLGIGAVLIPVLASLAVAIFLGWLFLLGGAMGAITTLMGRQAPGFWWALVSSVITLVAGFFMIGWPLTGAVSITLVLAAYLAADGVVTIFFALDHSRQLSQQWGWMVVNGVIDLLMAALIVWVIPFAALWVLGLIVGIDFIFGGASLISMAVALRR
jgi:uncharacterized membrane protein HdeD (DUF308 family)